MYCDSPGAAEKANCKCVCSGKERQLLSCSGQTKQLEMLVTVLSNVKNEQLLFVKLFLKPCKRSSDWRKISIERSGLVVSSVVFIAAVRKIKSRSLTFLENIINSILLRKFPGKFRVRLPCSRAPPPRVLRATLLKPLHYCMEDTEIFRELLVSGSNFVFIVR